VGATIITAMANGWAAALFPLFVGALCSKIMIGRRPIASPLRTAVSLH
jgi:hypothetical protein